MLMLCGRILKEFLLNDKKITIRYPRFEDYKGLHHYVNSLVKEKAHISLQKPIDRKKEMEWLLQRLRGIERGEEVVLVVEVDGKVAGCGNVKKGEGALNHVGELGIGLARELRGRGLGQKFLNILLEEARKRLKIKIVKLSVFSNNEVAIHIYKKFGFKEVGRIKKGVKYYDRYVDDIIMVKYLNSF